jgi:hypothetical protein
MVDYEFTTLNSRRKGLRLCKLKLEIDLRGFVC